MQRRSPEEAAGVGAQTSCAEAAEAIGRRMASEDARTELLSLTRSAAALLRWEEEISGLGVAPAVARTGASVAEPAGTPAAAVPPASDAVHEARSLRVLAEEAAVCQACRLHEGRTRSVFARGDEQAEIVFIGEGPGYNEDQEGVPFVGQAGELLDKMVLAMGYEREAVYICNVVKCRPPQNRAPSEDEAAACAPFLDAQLAQVSPSVIVALGRSAAMRLGCVEPEGRGWRGKWSSYRGVPVMATYHPAYLLRTPAAKRQVWDDLQAVLARIGRPLPRGR